MKLPTNHQYYPYITTQPFLVQRRQPGPPDPINDVCSLTGKFIQENYFTYRPVKIFKIIVPEILLSESDSPHKIMRYDIYYSTQLFF